MRLHFARPFFVLIFAAGCLVGCAGSRKGSEAHEAHEPELLASRHRDRLAVGNGGEDSDNKYQTVVKVLGLKGVLCSGVLVDQRLVLTAAHCFCEVTEKPFDRKTNHCRKKTKVTRVFYFYNKNEKRWDESPDATDGEVIVHGDYAPQHLPGGKYVADTKKLPDLAVIRLDRAFTDGFLAKKSDNGEPLNSGEATESLRANVKLRSTEVSLDQEVVLVGFGATLPQGGDGGMRRFGKNVVSSIGRLDQADKKKREIRIQFPGTKTFEGDSGGPCFIEDSEGQWLVGIIGGYGEGSWGEEPWMTSIFGYQDWIEQQIADAAKLNVR